MLVTFPKKSLYLFVNVKFQVGFKFIKFNYSNNLKYFEYILLDSCFVAMPLSGSMPLMLNNYTVSRLGRKLSVDDQKVLVALPRDFIPERTWAEVLQKEDTELMVLEMREEIVEEAINIAYGRYMERQTAPFTVHCAAQAWLQLIDWHFYKHDPGEDPSAYPPCFIPKRVESWTPDEMPLPSPKDAWGRENLNVIEEVVEETLRKWPSSQSVDLPVVEPIPQECWFPGKVMLPGYMDDESYDFDSITFDESVSSDLGTESELLQKVTNYTPGETSVKESTTMMTFGSQKGTTTDTTEVLSSLHGGGDSATQHSKIRAPSTKSKIFNRSSMLGRSKNSLPPLQSDSRSRASVISDCRLRSLRLDTQYEISSEKIDSAPKVNIKRK
ncbi:uncharacterized protein C2orf81 homolog [Cydia pomonella]|uniref:uncharacterized protein C2orf81 homolog n=1 Tax=Cydia pomonella TaxID=82600 RepID=UPI002ADD3B53|nr:uncharacterized protein C2orf81 homolog [Cydia pomonella]